MLNFWPEGEVTISFTYLRLSQEGFTLKGKNLLLLEQILFFKSKPQFERAISAREANRKSPKLFPLVKMAEKHVGVPIHLKSAELYPFTANASIIILIRHKMNNFHYYLSYSAVKL